MSTVVKDLGAVSAYAYAVEKGYTGTEAEFAELMADYAEVGQRAEDAADSALESKTAAQTAATTATNKAGEATTAAQTATTKAGEASQSASTATSAKDTAVSASQTATSKATEATTAAGTATTAKNDAVTAKTAAETAQGKAETAQGAAEDAAESVSASAAQIATNTSDISELKSDFSALESDGVAPSAEQLLSKNMTADAVPYLFRQTGGNGADREYVDVIVGGTVAWNQIFKNTVYSTSTESGVTYTKTSDYVWTLNGTASAQNTKSILSSSVFAQNHVFCIGNFNSFGGKLEYLFNGWKNSDAIVKKTDVQNLQLRHSADAVFSNNALSIAVFDLTAMFGTTIADYIYSLEQSTTGAGVALFKSLFPKDYYPYNAGELLSVSGLSAHKTVGFNQWDEEWELGRFNTTTGEDVAATDQIRAKNLFAVLPNTQYYVISPYSYMWCMFYDENRQPIDAQITVSGNPKSGKSVGLGGGINPYTTPGNARYMRFYCQSGYGSTYKNDICINLSDPARNGEYEPYVKRSYPLDSSLTLRGIPKLSDGKMYYDGDRYLPDGKVERRYGVVDLGTFDWEYVSSGDYFKTNINTKKYGNTNIICSKYKTTSSTTVGGMVNGEIKGNIDQRTIYIKDSAYTDATAFKTAMSGVMLVYELATPTTEEADPYQHLQQCDPSGTEEYISTGIVPVGHNSFYPENLRAKVEGLPWNFASLIAPTESDFVATRNYVTGDLFIVSNVLYKATSNIANGGMITPNTNCTATTLAEIISALA